MAYQQKKRSQEQQLPIPQLQASRLFASPELNPEMDNARSSDVATAPTSLAMRQQQANQPSFNLGNISIFSPEGTAEQQQQPLPLQAKLTVGAAGDKYEQEADQVAAQVVETINRPHSQQAEPVETAQPEAMPSMNRMPQPMGHEGGTVSNQLATDIQSEKGKGHNLDPGLQAKMEQAMGTGTDLSTVKIHTDAKADDLNQAIQAKAFTTGNDVFFKQGEYQPNSHSGQELIAHELTHVAQQTGNAVQRKSSNVIQRQGDNESLVKKTFQKLKPQTNSWKRLALEAAGHMVNGLMSALVGFGGISSLALAPAGLLAGLGGVGQVVIGICKSIRTQWLRTKTVAKHTTAFNRLISFEAVVGAACQIANVLDPTQIVKTIKGALNLFGATVKFIRGALGNKIPAPIKAIMTMVEAAIGFITTIGGAIASGTWKIVSNTAGSIIALIKGSRGKAAHYQSTMQKAANNEAEEDVEMTFNPFHSQAEAMALLDIMNSDDEDDMTLNPLHDDIDAETLGALSALNGGQGATMSVNPLHPDAEKLEAFT